MKKRVIKVLLAIAVVVSLLVAVNLVANAATEGIYTYTVRNGEATITGCDTSVCGNIVIPSTLGGYSVTTIGSWAFDNCISLTSVTIPNSVTTIGSWAFYNCTSLTSVTIGNSVTSIGDYAFNQCQSLRSVTIPDSVISIGEWAFGYCSSLTDITIPDSVTSIGDYAFDNCTSLTSMEIPDSVTSIGVYAFRSCSLLKNIVISDSIINIERGVFQGCASITSVIIPDGVTSIGNCAFDCCKSLTSITIPDSVTSIGYMTFDFCTSLINVYYYGTEAEWNEISIDYYNTYLRNATIHFLGNPADYSAVEEALAKVEALDRTLYTEASLNQLDDVVAGIDYTLKAKDKAIVDAYAAAIEDAVSNLEYKADYTAVDTALAKVPADLTVYTDESAQAVTDAVNAVVYDLTVKEQAIVDAYAQAIEEAVSNLVYKPADYTAVDTALAKVPADLTVYTDETAQAVTDAVNAVVYDLTAKEQVTVDAYAVAIEDAVANLEYKADYTAVEEALAKVPADLTIYTAETAQAVTDAVNAVVYGLTADKQETVDGYAQAIEDAVANLEIPGMVKLTDNLVNYRLRCTTKVVDGNLVLTATTAGTSSMKVRLGNLPTGATVAMVGTNANASMASGIITVTNPGMKNVNVPMVITSANGVKTEFVLVADFNNAIRYATYARLSQTGNDITITSGATTAYVLFDTTDIEGGYVEVENVSRNLLGRYVISGSAVRFYNPVYDEGTVTVNVKNANGETVETYGVTVIFADATEYTPVLESSLRCTYTVDGDNITVTANAGVSNVYLNFGRYYSERLSASVNDDIIKKMGARSWRIIACDEPVEFDLYFDATTYDSEVIVRHVIVNF